MITIQADDCPHSSRCRAKKIGPHTAECPSNIGLTDADVDEFCAKYVTEEQYDHGHFGIRGEYRGLTASSSGNDADARRWLAEDLMKCAGVTSMSDFYYLEPFDDAHADCDQCNGGEW